MLKVIFMSRVPFIGMSIVAPFSPPWDTWTAAAASPCIVADIDVICAMAFLEFSVSCSTVIAESKPESIRTAADPAAIVARILFLILCSSCFLVSM